MAGKKLRNILIPLIAWSFCTTFAWKPKYPNNQPVTALPIAHPNFWLMDEEENISPVALLPVLSSE